MSLLRTAVLGRGDDCCDAKADEISSLARQDGRRRVLYVVLAINLVMFAVEGGAALVAHSSALLADSTDMLGDAAVYAMSIFVVGRSLQWRAGAATLKGVIILGFGVAVFVSVARALFAGAEPTGATMSIFGLVALAANLVCLGLLWQFRADDVNMASTFECSRNDVAANVGVIVAGIGVSMTGRAWPDITVGLIIALIFLRSAIATLATSIPALRGRESTACTCPDCA